MSGTSRNELDLNYILNIRNFEQIQDAMAAATEMAMVTVDYQGNRVTRHSRCSAFCQQVRSSADFGPICEKCDAHGGLEATRLGRPYIYLCHMGILDFAVPIIVHGQYIGAIMAGQVRLIDEADKDSLDQLMAGRKQTAFLQTNLEMATLYGQLPLMTMDRIRANADMMRQISNYIVEEALLKIRLMDRLGDQTPAAGLVLAKPGLPAAPVSNGKTEFPAGAADPQKPPAAEAAGIATAAAAQAENIILKPALAYIRDHFSQSISLDEMAARCNISASYFSKLFNKVVGDNLAAYVNKIRIGKACELLAATDTPILPLAMDLGFDDSGYFIKVFKKLTGETPAAYRSLHRRS